MTTRSQYRVINPADLADLANQVNTVLLQLGARMDQGEWCINSLMFTTENVNPKIKLGYGTWELFASGSALLTLEEIDEGYNTTLFVYKRTA